MKKILRYTLIGLLWAGVVAYFVYAAVQVRRHRAAQRVERMEIEVTDGTEKMRLVTAETVEGWIEKSGIPALGATIGEVDLSALERMIAGNGFVADARVSVTWSGVLRIRVGQRTPLMRLLVDGYDSYITDEGYVFAVPRGSSVYVPVVTGSWRPLFPPDYTGDAADRTRGLLAAVDERIEGLEREKYPLYRRELKNDDDARAARRMRVKKGWFESKESFAVRVGELRDRKEQLRRKYRYEGVLVQAEIDGIAEKQEAERLAKKKLQKKGEDLRKLVNFVRWVEQDDFWSEQIVQITARTTVSGAIELELTPRSGRFTILFGRLEDVGGKFGKLLEFYRGVLERVGWERYATIDVRYKGQVICRE